MANRYERLAGLAMHGIWIADGIEVYSKAA
jgi:hypothetical protein